MKVIDDEQELKGKVIKDVIFLDGEEDLCFLFEDDTCTMISAEDKHYDRYELVLKKEIQIDVYDKLEAGMISREEYDKELGSSN